MKDHPDVALCGALTETFGGAIGSGRRRYDAWLNSLTTHDAIVRELFVECPIPHPTFFMRKDAFEEVGGYEEHGWAEDYDLCMRLFMAGKRFGQVPTPLLKWRESPGRLSSTHSRYSPANFRALKRHYLFQTYLKDPKPFYQWGAGDVGKRWLREWGERRPVAVVDINPRKLGQSIHGTPVITAEELPPPGEAFIIVAVGARGARDDIRARLTPRGHVELRDFLFVA